MLKLVVHAAAARLLVVNILPLTNNNDPRSCKKHTRTHAHTHTHTRTHKTDLIVKLIVQHRGSSVEHYKMVLNFSLNVNVSDCEDNCHLCFVLPLATGWSDGFAM